MEFLFILCYLSTSVKRCEKITKEGVAHSTYYVTQTAVSTSASGSYGRQAGRKSDEIREDLKFLKSSTDCIVRNFIVFYEGTV